MGLIFINLKKVFEKIDHGSQKLDPYVETVLRKVDDEFVKHGWKFDFENRRGEGRPKLGWKGMLEKENLKVGVNFEDANDQAKKRSYTKSWKENQ